MSPLLLTTILWIHLFFAIIFIGGSFFIWFALWPASFEMTSDEKQRTMIVGLASKRFARITNISVGVLIITGLLLAYGMFSQDPGLLSTGAGAVLLIKSLLVAAAIGIMYYNNLTHPKKIVRLLAEGKKGEVDKIRRRAHFLSYLTLALLVLVTVFGAVLVGYY